jgi:hypothetical protein
MPSPNSFHANSYYICTQCQQLAPNSPKHETVTANGLLYVKCKSSASLDGEKHSYLCQHGAQNQLLC